MSKSLVLIISISFMLAACGKNEQTDSKSLEVPDGIDENVGMVEEELIPPKLLEPENNATVFEEKPMFKWTEVPGDRLYQVEIHQYEGMEAPAWSDYPEGTSWRIEEKFMGLDHGKTYYWRVKRGQSDWSEVYSFTVDLKNK